MLAYALVTVGLMVGAFVFGVLVGMHHGKRLRREAGRLYADAVSLADKAREAAVKEQ